ncbi:MAG TPA: hypothetical protein VF765_07140 [Polyangiaceae bacterium]
MRARFAAALIALAVASCGGKTEGPGGGGGGSGGGGGTSSGGTPVGGDLPPGQTGTGGGTTSGGSSSSGNSAGPGGGPGPTCTMSAGDGSVSTDGGCDSVDEYATCAGSQYQVSCECRQGASICHCVKNGQITDQFTSLSGCTGCDLPAGAWSECRFP